MKDEQLLRTEVDPGETTYKIIDGTKFKITTQCVGDKRLLDIIKSAIKRDIENGS